MDPMRQHFPVKVTMKSKIEALEIETKKRHELWFMVNGTTTRFGMREFALITGLNCGETPKPDVVLKASKNIRLLEHFKSHVVLVADLKKLLTGKKIKGSDKAKIAIIYFLAQVLLSGDEKKTVPLDWLSYVEDLEFFNSYPWGRVSFECTLRALKKNLREKFQKWVRKGRNKSIKETYSICGFLWAFQV
ncbi:uncharacterized protein LOC112091355 [Morus notabilis]|uniref:uncharacterized protein LOC112091355 n=1 Tax=Morus notabilis TaxID=981085 RepID=UPI000CED60F7|nr:uncharacterized protein LOC112091355 [Morus notabilis]